MDELEIILDGSGVGKECPRQFAGATERSAERAWLVEGEAVRPGGRGGEVQVLVSERGDLLRLGGEAVRPGGRGKRAPTKDSSKQRCPSLAPSSERHANGSESVNPTWHAALPAAAFGAPLPRDVQRSQLFGKRVGRQRLLPQ